MPKLPSIAFVNASPLIILAKSGHLELLRVAGNQVCVPKTVHQEVCTGSSDSVTRHAVENASWLEVVEVPNIPASVLAWDLGPGESSVIACAKKVPGSESVIDDPRWTTLCGSIKHTRTRLHRNRSPRKTIGAYQFRPNCA